MNPTSSNARHVSPRRWALLLAAAGVAGVAACDSSLTTGGAVGTWGFITVAAGKNSAGLYRTQPLGQFFKGTLSSGVPNSLIVFDSCVTNIPYSPASEVVSGPSIQFLDAGEELTLQIGGEEHTLPRLSNQIATIYQTPAITPITYTPGDSVVVTIPGATQGYPAAEIRGKTAEAFTMSTIEPPDTEVQIPVTWTPATEPGSAMIISLRYQPAGATAINSQILCSFKDDGTDSIRTRWHEDWSASTVVSRSVVATRLRTAIIERGDGVLEILSRFQVPTPPLN
jgi:hypothetical protein